MELVFEGGDHAEVPATTPHPPKQVRVLGGAGRKEPAVSGDHVNRKEIIACEAVLSAEPPNAAAQSESHNTRIRNCSPGAGQAEGLGLNVVVQPGQTRLGASRPPAWVDADPLHLGHVNNDPTIAHGVAPDVVATTADRHQKIVCTGEID